MSKKNTPKPSAEQVKTVSDQELTFLFDSAKKPDDANMVAQALLKVRTEASLIVLDKSDVAANLPDVLALKEKSRCHVIGSLRDLAERCGKVVYVVDDAASFIPQAVVSCFALNKKSFTESDAVYAGEFNKQSGKLPINLLQKAGIGLYNLLAGILVPAGIKDYTHPFVFFGKDAAVKGFNSNHHKSISVCSRLAYLSTPVVAITLSAKEHQLRKVSFKKIISNILSPRVSWFIKDPLMQFGVEDAAGYQPLYRLLFAAFFLFACIAMPYFSQDFGITWDAKRHNQYGYQMLNYFTSFGSDSIALSATSPIQEFRYYGEHFNVISAFFNTYLGVLGEFEMRHLLNALYGLLAMLFAALAAKQITSWRGAFFALIIIFCSPVFFAHSMNNPTDIPFAAGSAMALYYLIKILQQLPKPALSHLVLCGAGIGMAIGSRVGGIIWYAYVGLFLGISWLLVVKKEGMPSTMKLIWPYARILLLIVIIGHLVGISLWPFAQQQPFTNWYEALKKSTEGAYFTFNHELFEGARMYMANVPWYYLPKFIFINTPEVVWVGIALVLSLLWVLKRNYKNWYAIGVVIFVAVFPISYAEVQSMYYYNGWRHYLFVYPPIAILAACGWDGLGALTKNKISSYASLAGILLLCALPAFWMIQNHPNECVYFNAVSGGTKAAYGKYEMDYYSNSCREAAEWLAKQEPNKKMIVGINNEPLTASYYANKYNPDMEFRWMREYEEQKLPWDYAILTSRTFSSKELEAGAFPPKGTVYTVMADGVPLAAVVRRENDLMPKGYQYFEARNFDTAIFYFRQAAAYNPKDEEVFRMLGLCYLSNGNAPEAIRNLNKAIEIYPENYMAWSNLGLVEINLNKNPDKAIEYFKKANSYKFNYTDAYYYTAMAHYQKGDFGTGLKFLEMAVKRGGGSVADVYYNLGLGYYNTGSYKKAEDNLILALTLDQKSVMSYRLLAEVFNKQGKSAEAQECMNRYYALGGR